MTRNAGNVPKIGSVKEGTFVVRITCNPPWPPAVATTLLTKEFEDGTACIIGEPSGKLRVMIFKGANSQNPALDKRSCKLEIAPPMDLAIAASWNDDGVSIAINGKIVASTNEPAEIPDVFNVPPLKSNSIPQKDYSKENAAAFKRRKDTMAGTHPLPNRISAGDKYVMDRLNDELHLISDAISQIENGKKHYLISLANSLRKCISTGHPLPHFQMCAAIKNLPLIVYTCSNPREDKYDEDALVLSGDCIFPEPVPSSSNPIDLDVWLNQNFGQFEKELFTHVQAIKKFGDTIGSHFDKDMAPLVVTAKTSTSHMGGVNRDLM